MNCPDFQSIIDYLEGELAPAKAEVVGAHLDSGCQSCAAVSTWYNEVRSLASTDNSVEPPPWVLKRAVRLFDERGKKPGRIGRFVDAVAALVFDSNTRPLAMGVRSSTVESRQLLYESGDYHVDLQVGRGDSRSSDIFGQVLSRKEAGFDSVSGLLIELLRGDIPVGRARTEPTGEFVLKQVKRGEYDLKVHLKEGSITIKKLQIETEK